jgi:predicted DCC family thiol-disulfide oxidoreductase YuxK
MIDTQTGEVDATVVLYDGACPLCRREIAHYRRLRGAERIRWVDIAQTPDIEQHYGISRARAMAQFHVRDPAGRWQVGASAFVELWRHLPGYRHAARAVSAMRLVYLMDRAYARFARWRLRRQCDDERCERPRHADRSTTSS